METVWVQNLKGFIKGTFPADDRWKEIFIERLNAVDADIQNLKETEGRLRLIIKDLQDEREQQRATVLDEAAEALENAAPIEETPERLVPFHDSMGELLGEFVEPSGHKWKYLSGKKAAAIVRALNEHEGAKT